MLDLLAIFGITSGTYATYKLLYEAVDTANSLGKSLVLKKGDLNYDVKVHKEDYIKRLNNRTVDEYIEDLFLQELNNFDLSDKQVIKAFKLKYDYLNMKKAVRVAKNVSDFKPRYSKLSNISVSDWQSLLTRDDKIIKSYKKHLDIAVSKPTIRSADFYLDTIFFKYLKSALSKILDLSDFLEDIIKDEIDLSNMIEFKRCRVFTCALEIGIKGGHVDSDLLKNKDLTHQDLLDLYKGTTIGKALEKTGPIKYIKQLRLFDKIAHQLIYERYKQKADIKDMSYSYMYAFLKTREHYYDKLRTIIKLKLVDKPESFIKEQL